MVGDFGNEMRSKMTVLTNIVAVEARLSRERRYAHP